MAGPLQVMVLFLRVLHQYHGYKNLGVRVGGRTYDSIVVGATAICILPRTSRDGKSIAVYPLGTLGIPGLLRIPWGVL